MRLQKNQGSLFGLKKERSLPQEKATVAGLNTCFRVLFYNLSPISRYTQRMSNTMNLQAVVSQALQQLVAHQANAPQGSQALVKQGIQVLVQQLAGNRLQLSLPTALRGDGKGAPANAAVLIDTTGKQLPLTTGQHYQIQLDTSKSAPSLLFFAKETASNTLSQQPVSRQNLALLLQSLPLSRGLAKQLDALPAITVGIVNSHKGQNGKTQLQVQLPAPSNSVSPPKITLQLQQPPASQSVKNTGQIPVFPPGESIRLTLQNTAKYWQVQLEPAPATGNNTSTSLTATASAQLSQPQDKASLLQVLLARQAHTASKPTLESQPQQKQGGQQPASSATATQQIPQPAHPFQPIQLNRQTLLQSLRQIEQATPAMTSSASQGQNTPKMPQQRAEQGSSQPLQSIMRALQASHAATVTLSTDKSGQPRLHIVTPDTPLLRIPISPNIAKQITQHLLQPASQANQQPSDKTGNTTAQASNTIKSQPPQTQSAPANSQYTKQGAMAQPAQPGSTITATPSMVDDNAPSRQPSLTSVQSAQLAKIAPLLRKVLVHTAPPAHSVQHIQQAISDPQLQQHHLLKPLLQPVREQLASIQNQPPSFEQIRHWLTAPALPLSNTLTQVTGSTSNSLVQGLVSLLQLGLSARLQHQQPAHQDSLLHSISRFIPSLQSATRPALSRAVQDLAQNDNRYQLIREIGRLLAGHTSSKLASAEQSLQGQDNLYYVLPHAQGQAGRDTELLIRREQPGSQPKKAKHNKHSVWHLSVKLDVGEQGQILSKAKLQNQTLTLNMYVSKIALKTRVLEYLPYLNKRLTQLGIEVSQSQCQLGVIPEHLQARPHQIFSTQV